MKHMGGLTCAIVATLVARAAAQLSRWSEGQFNTTICTWEQPRAAIIRDTIYLDGGKVWWIPGLDNGTYGTVASGSNFDGVVMTYNLSNSFTADTNVTGLLVQDTLSKALGGSGSSTPNYEDGGMLANDGEFFLYGGAVFRNEDLYDDPDADSVMEYLAYQYSDDGDQLDLFEKGFREADLGDVTRYVAYGAAASAPSENKAWYFSGLTSPTRGPFFSNPGLGNDTKAIDVSDRLITVDMSEQFQEEWSNDTLTDGVKGRSNAELVWVPVGEQGILVVLGGVVYPEWAGTSAKSANEDESEDESPKFISDIDVYDVASKKWYTQPTNDGPGTRTRGCAVVARASDSSSFNIYYYGGYDGIHAKDPFYDDVWVLSLPSFTWTQINKGQDEHARAGQKCFAPYPDQMMVFGGYTPQPGYVRSCLDPGPVVIFNTTSGEWMDSYDPTKHSDYGVPEKVLSKIGGDASGGATATAPVGDGWATQALGEVFATPYDMDKITTYYPYAATSETSRPDAPDDSGDGDGNGDGLPSWVAPVLGVVLGLMFLTGVAVAFILWKRRKYLKNHPQDAGTEDAGSRIVSWLRGHPPADKAVTVTSSDETPGSPEMMDESKAAATTPSAFAPTTSSQYAEMEDNHIAELGDTSPPVELHDTGLSPVDIIQRHSHVGKNSRSLSNPSSFSGGGGDYNSTISRSSAAAAQSPAAASDRVDSPTQGTANQEPSPEPPYERVTSGVSSVTERDAGHLRQVSEATVSSTGMHPVPVERPAAGRAISETTEPAATENVTTPVSPPSAADSPGEDYLAAREMVSPMRRSAFHESEEDMGKQQ